MKAAFIITTSSLSTCKIWYTSLKENKNIHRIPAQNPSFHQRSVKNDIDFVGYKVYLYQNHNHHHQLSDKAHSGVEHNQHLQHLQSQHLSS